MTNDMFNRWPLLSEHVSDNDTNANDPQKAVYFFQSGPNLLYRYARGMKSVSPLSHAAVGG